MSVPHSSEIYKILESEIVALKIAPGDVLTENSLCERFHVSRTPIRSVLQRLQENRFVQIIPHKSTTVTPINLDVASQLIYERVAIESMVFRDFIRTVSPPDAEKVRYGLYRMEQVAQKARDLEHFDIYEFLECDHAMHALCFEATGKAGLGQRMTRSPPDYSRLMPLDAVGARNVQEVLADHQEMMRMIDAREEEHIEELMVRHLYGNVRRLGGRLFSDEYKKYFQPLDQR